MAHQTVRHPGHPDAPRADAAEPTASCPVEITLDVLRGRWTTLVLRELLRNDLSFTDFRQALPVLSDKVLSDRLAHLVQSGVVERRSEPGWPPRTQYALTPQGRRLGPVRQALWDRGESVQPNQRPAKWVTSWAAGVSVADRQDSPAHRLTPSGSP